MAERTDDFRVFALERKTSIALVVEARLSPLFLTVTVGTLGSEGTCVYIGGGMTVDASRLLFQTLLLKAVAGVTGDFPMTLLEHIGSFLVVVESGFLPGFLCVAIHTLLAEQPGVGALQTMTPGTVLAGGCEIVELVTGRASSFGMGTT